MNKIIPIVLISFYLVGCATFIPVSKNDDIPIFVAKNIDPEKFFSEFSLMVKDVEAQTRALAGLKKSREGLPRGEVRYHFKIRKAVGYTSDGKKIEGIILVEDTHWKGSYRPEITNKIRTVILNRFSNLAKPIYVKEVVLED